MRTCHGRHTQVPVWRFPRVQLQPLLAHLKNQLPIHHVEPFLLMQVEVQRRSARQQMCVLHHEEAAGGFAGWHFEENRTKPQGKSDARRVGCCLFGPEGIPPARNPVISPAVSPECISPDSHRAAITPVFDGLHLANRARQTDRIVNSNEHL